ncbi:RidA family protein [soil metagenome]
MSKEIIVTQKAPAPIGPYSQAVVAGNFLFLSGQIALVPGSDEILTADIQTETRRVMENIAGILAASDYSFNDVVKTTIFLTDMSLFAQVNEVYGTYFTGTYPARETVAVKGLPKNVNVEISMTAFKNTK